MADEQSTEGSADRPSLLRSRLLWACVALAAAVVALVVALFRQHTETVLWRERQSTTQVEHDAEAARLKAEAERLRRELERVKKEAEEAERRKRGKPGDPDADWLCDRVPCNQGDLLGPGRRGDAGAP